MNRRRFLALFAAAAAKPQLLLPAPPAPVLVPEIAQWAEADLAYRCVPTEYFEMSDPMLYSRVSYKVTIHATTPPDPRHRIRVTT